MPALNEQAYELAKPHWQVNRTDQVFLIRFTGEVFPDYELYLSKLNFYRQRQWSCQVTGKQGLTYEEAATSEQKIKNATSQQFPAIYEDPVIRHIHHSTHKLDDLAGRIAAHFRDSFVCGEEVVGTKDGTPMACRVIAVHEAPPVEGVEASVFDTQYDVQWVTEGRLTGEPLRMPRTDLFRKKPVVAKPMLKTWIAEVASCETVQGVKGVACIWRALDDFVDRFNLPLELPVDLQQKLRKAEQRKAQQASKASSKTAASKAAEQQSIKDQAAAIAAAAFAQGSEAESDHPPEMSHPQSIKEQAAAIAAAAFGQAPAQPDRQKEPIQYYDDEEEDEEVDAGAQQDEEDSDEGERRPAKRKRMPVPRPTAGTPAKAESLEEVEQRLQPGSVKHAIFQVLRNYDHKGRSVGKIVEEMSKKGLREFSTARNAKSSVASTCAHDTAFARVAPGTFALRAVPGVVEVPPSTPGTKSTPADREEQEESEEPVIKPAPRFAKFERNNFKCTRCLKMHHPEGSPLALCDSCPRSFHLLCLGVEWEELSEGDWACPRCAERKGIPTKRLTVDDVKNRQSTGNGRMSKVEQEKTDKMLIKSLEREERERKRAEERAEKEAQRQLEKDAKNREREEAKMMARYPIEDMEVAQEELAALLEAQQDVRRAMQSGQSSRRLDEEQQELQQQHLAEAEARADKLRMLVHGPQAPAPLFADTAATASYLDALAVVEIVNTFGRLWETPPSAWQACNRPWRAPRTTPSWGSYTPFCCPVCFWTRVNEEGPGKSRARRWARVFHRSTCTWPEILRRYLLATRAKTGIPHPHLTTPDPQLSLLPDSVAAVKGALELAAKPWYRLSAPLHLRVLTALCNDILEGASMRAELAGRVDQISALHSELFQKQLEERRQEKAEERERKQEERQRRLEQLEKQLQGLQQTAPDGAPADDQNRDQDGDQAKSTGDGAITPGDRSAPDDEEEDHADQEGSDDEDDDDNKSDKSDDDNEQEGKAKGQSREGSEPPPEGADPPQPKSGEEPAEQQQQKKKKRSRQDLNAEYEARIDELPLRIEPVGLDRHHRKYWLLSGDPTAIHVQSAEGDAISVIDTPTALDAALAACNRKGNREKALMSALKRDHTSLRGQLRPGMPRGVSSSRPPLVEEQNVGQGVGKTDRITIQEAVEQLQELLAECSVFQGRLPKTISFKGLQQRLDQVHTAVQLCQEMLGIEGAVSLLGSGPRGSDSVAKASTQGTLAAPDPLPEASPTPEHDPPTKPEPTPEPEPAPQSAAGASPSPQGSESQHTQQQQHQPQQQHQQSSLQQQQTQQAAAVQWVETDDLGVSRRQVGSVPKPALPNGPLPHAQGSVQQPHGSTQLAQGNIQQPQGSSQLGQGSVQQPQGSVHRSQGSVQQPQGGSQAPEGSVQQAEGGVHGAEGSRGVRAEGWCEHLGSAEQADPSEQSVKQEFSDAPQTQTASPQSRLGLQSPAEGGQPGGTSQLVSQDHLVFAQPLEELNPSDTEQEKASRPKLALWRSARERGIWMQDMAAAQASTSAAEVAYLAALLSDKAQPMLQRLSASAAAAAARPPKAAKASKRERDTPTLTPDQPPDAKKLKIKLAGSGQSSQQGGSSSGKGANKDGDRWMAECADCGEEGDLLCCEAKECPIAMHKDCAGLDKVPRGKWYCPQHASQAKASKPRPSGAAKASGDMDSSSAPSTSGKAGTAGPSAPGKAGASLKSGGKGKGKAQSEDDSGQGDGSRKSSGKAGKKRQAEAEVPDLAPKGSSKASKAQAAGSSKAGKAQSKDDAGPSAAPARKKAGSGDVAVKKSADKQKSGKGKDDAKRQHKDAPVPKGNAAAPVANSDPEEKFEATNVSDKHGSIKVKFKRLKKANS